MEKVIDLNSSSYPHDTYGILVWELNFSTNLTAFSFSKDSPFLYVKTIKSLSGLFLTLEYSSI